MTSIFTNSSFSASCDIFQKLPEQINGYILTFLKILDFINVYDNIQGRIANSEDSTHLSSRSNLIFSENNCFGIISIELSIDSNILYLEFIILFPNITNLHSTSNQDISESIAEILPNFHLLKKLTLFSRITPKIIQIISNIGYQLVYF